MAGLAGLAITGVTYLSRTSDGDDAVGLAQRLGLMSVHVWVALVHLTADDMPGGGDAVLTPGGMDLRPYWVLTPYFGMPWPLRCAGELRLGEGDTLAGRIDMSLLGFLPLGRMSLRLRRT